VILKACHKDWTLRYRSGGEFRQALLELRAALPGH